VDQVRQPTELTDLIDRIAAHPHGLGFLHRAYLDSVAVTLGVHPYVVEAVRAYMETPQGRTAMIEQVREARQRAADQSTSRSFPVGTAASTEGVQTKSPEKLIEEAKEHPLGIDFLLHGPPETVAVTFAVHPFIVFRARGQLEDQGGVGYDASDGGT
jgi:hypothetical protein